MYKKFKPYLQALALPLVYEMKTCREKIYSVLSRGGRWTNVQIANVFLNEFHEPNMNNTICKYLSFMIKDGFVQSYRVPGKSYSEYEMLKSESELITRCKAIAKTYPEGHLERRKIEVQIEQMQRSNTQAA